MARKREFIKKNRTYRKRFSLPSKYRKYIEKISAQTPIFYEQIRG